MIGYIPIWGKPKVHFEQIKRRNNSERIVILGETEFHYNSILSEKQLLIDICDYADSKNIPVYFITGLSRKNSNLIPEDDILYNRFTVLYWPTYWFSYSLLLFNRFDTKEHNSSNGLDIELITPYRDYEHTFVCMNNQPHIHRIALMDMFAKYDLIDTNKISFRKVTDATFYYWQNPKSLFLDQESNEGIIFTRENLPNCYNNCFMHVAGESDGQTLYTLSGSTVIPLLFNKPFLNLGPQYFMKHLEDLGFLKYNEIFDYSYDSISNMEERAEVFASEIKRIEGLKNQWKQMYFKIYPKLVHNRKLALKYAFDISHFPPIYMQLSQQEFIPDDEIPYPYFHYPSVFMGNLNNIHDKFQQQKLQ